jgi:hypothetical protein
MARAEAPRFDGSFRIDLDIDATEDVVTFSKPPLEAALDTPLGPIRLIGVHVKSKAPHGAQDRGRGHEPRHRQPAQATGAMHLAAATDRQHLAEGDR